jgi:hypothetical protein
MTQHSDVPVQALRPFAVAAYLVALLLILAPPLEVMTNLSTLQLTDARWRFGATGLMTGSLLLPVAGFLLAIMTAVLTGHRWVFWGAMAGGVLLLVGMLAMVGMFVLDAMQVRPGVAQPMVRRFDGTVVRSVLTQLFQVIALGAVLWSGLVAQRHRGRRAAAEGRRAESGVVVGAGR